MEAMDELGYPGVGEAMVKPEPLKEILMAAAQKANVAEVNEEVATRLARAVEDQGYTLEKR